ncbi:hypothetical protein, partial [Streptomyces sp. MP131-18]|uniref:hypothetical protein n=1 Tax=Streptomyces sp. MP131-18 TaxID=1857892 RepID=UPI001C0B4FBC
NTSNHDLSAGGTSSKPATPTEPAEPAEPVVQVVLKKRPGAATRCWADICIVVGKCWTLFGLA